MTSFRSSNRLASPSLWSAARPRPCTSGVCGSALALFLIMTSPAALAQPEPPPPPPAPPATTEAPPATGTAPASELPADTTAPTPAAADPSQLKAVVVTAQRREESAQKVPTALSVLAGDDLLDKGIGRSAREVLDYVPNASAATQQHGRPRWWIRGIGTGQQQLDFSNPVGFYLDDVYISNASATGFPLFDLERVEVLRGPQGTLWGKNTTGGAVSVVSRKPSFTENDGYLKLDYGSFDDKLIEGAGNGSIIANRLAGRASFHAESRDGRFRDLNTGRKASEFQDVAGRLQLLGKLTDNLEVLGNVHVRKYTTEGNVTTVTGVGPGGSFREGYVPSTGINDVSSNAPDNSDVRQTGALLSLRWALGGYTLTSISGFEEYEENVLNDSDYTPLEISRGWVDALSRQLSQELRVSSPRDDRWNWVAGLFYFYETINRKNATAKLPGVAQAVPGPSNYTLTVFDHDTSSFAAFASNTLALTSALKLTAGLRWTVETRDLDIIRIASGAGPATFSNIVNWWDPNSVSSPLAPVYDTDLSKTWNNLTFDVTPSWEIVPDVTLYFRYARGVKSGGFNTAATTPAALNVIEPEKLDSFELGTKTSWLQRRLTLNATAFRYNYRDIQINVVGPLPPTNTAVSYLQNVENGRVNGAELELETLPIQYLHLSGSLGLLDAEFTDFVVLNGGPDYSGNKFVRSPKVTTLLRADVTLPVSSQANLVLGGDWRYQSRQFHYTTNQDNPLLRQDGYSLVNARITLQDAEEKLSLVLYANNLTDVRYRNHTLPGATGATGSPVFWADPRTFGVALISRWW